MTGDRQSHSASEGEVRITREFRAPRELVFNAWIDPDHVSAWMAPEPCDVPRESVQVEPRAGGRIHFTQIDRESGSVYPVRFEILEISAPELLVLSSAPEPQVGLPYAMLTRVVFEVVEDGTRVTITQAPHTGDTLGRAMGGWQGSLDKLDRLLVRQGLP